MQADSEQPTPIGDARDFHPDAPSSAEYLNGRRDDGRPLPIYSKALVDPLTQALPGGEEKDPVARSLQEILLQYDLHALRDLELSSSLLRSMIAMGQTAIDTGNVPDGMTMNQVLNLSMAASKQLARNAVLTRKLAGEAALRANQVDVRRAFIEDRAHAVVANTLLALDEEFRELGFGAWMPFRYPDQWLMFCGVMRRVLAANGLLTVDDPEVYRRLLAETPYVEAAEDEGPNDPPRMPAGWARCFELRTVESMAALFDIIKRKEAT
jgi:hypothetical protein